MFFGIILGSHTKSYLLGFGVPSSSVPVLVPFLDFYKLIPTAMFFVCLAAKLRLIYFTNKSHAFLYNILAELCN